MDFSHHTRKVGKDDKGVFFEIRFGNIYEKIYADELFEEQIESGEDFEMKIHSFQPQRQKPNGFFENLSSEERNRICDELNIQPINNNPDPSLNAYKYIENQFLNCPPAMKWKGNSIAEHNKYKVVLIQKLTELVHYKRERVPLKVECGPITTYKNITLQKVYFNSAPNLRVAAILAYPSDIIEKNIRQPAIVTLNGHNQGKISAIGMTPSSSNSSYGIDLALEGFVTLSLDQWGWGERTGRYKKVENKPEMAFALAGLLIGEPALGIRAWDVSRALDYLTTLSFVEPTFGVVGHSGGGAATTYASVLDDRVHAAVISGHFCELKHSLMRIWHCACAYVPNILKFFDLPDIVATRAPKPTFIMSGEHDPIFPVEGVLSGYKKLEEIYSLYERPENLSKDIIKNQGHFFRGKYVYPWLKKMLNLI
jgi:cephalosporin-C deacetylase-like acetyl esterase